MDKITGPGNAWVAEAKRQVFGMVGIDGLPGPTETVVIADEGANPALAAADLLAQAEHDVLACAILLTPSRSMAEAARQQSETRSRAIFEHSPVALVEFDYQDSKRLLAALPYHDTRKALFLLQDFDCIAPSTAASTSSASATCMATISARRLNSRTRGW